MGLEPHFPGLRSTPKSVWDHIVTKQIEWTLKPTQPKHFGERPNVYDFTGFPDKHTDLQYPPRTKLTGMKSGSHRILHMSIFCFHSKVTLYPVGNLDEEEDSNNGIGMSSVSGGRMIGGARRGIVPRTHEIAHSLPVSIPMPDIKVRHNCEVRPVLFFRFRQPNSDDSDLFLV